jgi:hypothetical protein
MSSDGAAPRAAVSVSNARAEASRRNGAKSRGPKTAEGKARSAQNALKHGLRAQKHVVLPDEDALEFAELQAALLEELAPEGALQTVLARRVAVAAWRLTRADRMETELFGELRWNGGDLGLTLIRDGNGTRSFETLMRYRGAAMAEFLRALRTLKALQAGQAATTDAAAAEYPMRSAGRPSLARRAQPDQPERGVGPQLEYAAAGPGTPGRILHEAAASWRPKEPDARSQALDGAPAGTPAQPERKGAKAARGLGLPRPNQPEPARTDGGITGRPARPSTDALPGATTPERRPISRLIRARQRG